MKQAFTDNVAGFHHGLELGQHLVHRRARENQQNHSTAHEQRHNGQTENKVGHVILPRLGDGFHEVAELVVAMEQSHVVLKLLLLGSLSRLDHLTRQQQTRNVCDPAMHLQTLSSPRFHIDMGKPFSAMLKARFCPMTPKPAQNRAISTRGIRILTAENALPELGACIHALETQQLNRRGTIQTPASRNSAYRSSQCE